MKVNLKNFPRNPDAEFRDFQIWFEAFEKSLCEKLIAEQENWGVAQQAYDIFSREIGMGHAWGKIQLIKEILGEATA